MSNHVDVDTGHDYDGIHEFDNPLPRWWLATFYGTVVFAAGYWFFYHTLHAGELPRAAYEAEIKAADEAENARVAQMNLTDEGLQALTQDQAMVLRGQAVFQQNCIACHGDRGQGVVGPNLTDAYWLHGGKASQIYGTIGGGVLEKGMPAWRQMLGASKVRDVAAYVLTLRDKNVPGKAPQGTTLDGKTP